MARERASQTRARVALAGIRIFNGAAGLAAPTLLAKRVSPTPEPNPAAIYAFRLFGIRTVLIGADLLSHDRAVRQHAVQSALAVHASDVATAASLTLFRKVTPRAGLMLTAISALNVVLAVRARET